MNSTGIRRMCEKLTKSNIKMFMDSFDNVLTDCDGVLWHGTKPIPRTADVLSRFRKMGKKVFFVTNNSGQTRQEYVKKFHKHGYEADANEVFCTSTSAANYLKSKNFDKKVYVIGSTGITGELDNVGIAHTGIGPDVLKTTLIDWVLGGVELDSEVGAVIVGFDPHFNYVKMLKAATYLKNPDCLFIATNLDERFPSENNSVIVPGTGALVRAVSVAACRDPVVMGKPEKSFFDAIVYQHPLDPKRTLMIGDRLNTDILLGSVCGLYTLFVLTGVSSLDEVEKYKASLSLEDKKLIPNFYIDSLGDIMTLLE